MGASRIAGFIFLALVVSCGAAQKAKPAKPMLPPAEQIARTLFWEDAQHPQVPGDTLWNRAEKRAGAKFDTDVAVRVTAIIREIDRPHAFSCFNSRKLWSKPIPKDPASRKAWARCMKIGNEMVMGCYAPKWKVDHYHKATINPAWNRGMQFLGQVGKHLLWRARA